MKKILFLFWICSCVFSVYGQEKVFTYTSDGAISTNSKFIEDFGNTINTATIPKSIKSTESFSDGTGEEYTINCSKYDGWDADPGDFTVIDIKKGEQNIYQLKYDEGWDFFPQAWKEFTPLKSCYIQQLDKGATALIFQSSIIMSQPPYITIVIVKGDKATLVYNKPSYIENIQKKDDSTVFKLLENTIEWVGDGSVQYNDGIYNYLTIKGGTIYSNK